MDPLEEEIERGRSAALAVAEHLFHMRAAAYDQTVEFEGISYRVTAERLPHPSDFAESTAEPGEPNSR